MGNGPQYTLAQLNAQGVPEAIGPDNPLYVEGGGGGGGSLPTGTDRQVVGFDENGDPAAVTLGWAQLSDQPAPPNYPAGVLTMARIPETEIDEFGMIRVAVDAALNSIPVANAIPFYDPDTGGIPLFPPTAANHAANKQYVDNAVSGAAFPATSPNGEIEVDLTDEGFTIDSEGLRVLAKEDRLAVYNSADYQNFSVNEVGENVFVQVSSSGPNGFISLNGQIHAFVPISQVEGVATQPNHLVTKKYVDDAIAAAIAALP